ncbi:hypothetical protein Pcinc_009157 [Petrolisthes cinctipes]|uniref:Uncharacterized protein n=1 Tax=Petrolisthes cinctipes TaxID=88211 RepID=A0AAE1G7D4_PETCI|nr:hypothetical protein Pcinc_009157 [Petrolisthes cinctipes]
MVRQVSRSVTVVVVSSEPAFLSTFVELSLKGRLLVWSTRLLVLTRLPLHKLNQIRNTLAITNSMLILLSFFPSLRCDVYVELPYHVQEEPVRVASWNLERGIILSGHLTFFPDKFTRPRPLLPPDSFYLGMANHSYLLLSLSHLGTWSPFWIRYWNVGSPRRLLQKPQLQVARIVQTFPTKVINDMDTPGGKRIITWDPTVKMLETISEAMNFTTYSDVFKPELQQQPQSPPKHGVYHRIKTSGPPVFYKFRRLAFDKFAAAKRTFKLERLGICQKAISSWAFPLHIVTKKDCSLRPCGDYRCLNTKRSQTTTHFPTSPTTPPSSTVPESSQNWTC